MHLLLRDYQKNEQKWLPPGKGGAELEGDFRYITFLNFKRLKNYQLKNYKYKFFHCVIICDLKILLCIKYMRNKSLKSKSKHKATLSEQKRILLPAIILNTPQLSTVF